MKIEKGMYVRTNKGEILDVFCKTKNYIIAYFKEKPYKVEDIIKASYNIIDLIEEGDYVNEYYVYCVINGKIYVDTLDFKVGKNYFEKEDIFTIVTKEQFKNMEYRIE